MNKQELVDAVAEKTGLSKADSKRAVDAALKAIGDSLKRGGKVTLVGFGTFQIRTQTLRAGRNPKMGAKMTATSVKIPVFKPGKCLKDALSAGTDDPGPSIKELKVQL